MLTYIITGLGLATVYKVSKAIKCPKELEKIASMPMSSFFTFVSSQESFDDKMKKNFQPVMDTNGIIRVFGMTGWCLMVSDYAIIKEIASKPEIFCKPDPTKQPTNLNSLKFFGRSHIAINNGQEWKRHRKIINPIFSSKWNLEIFEKSTYDLIDILKLSNGEEIEVYDHIQRLTLDILGKSIFNIDFKSLKDPDSKLYSTYTYIINRLFNEPMYFILPFLEHLPYFKRSDLSKKIDEYDQFVESIIDSKYEEIKKGVANTEYKDLITKLILSNMEEDESKRLTRYEIRDNIKIFIMAGQDTTANTITTALYYLARYPEIQTKLRTEILNSLGNPSTLTTPTQDQLKSMSYLSQVIKETMRIVTTSSAVTRVTSQDYTLSNGVTIPKGTDIYCHLWASHHNSSFDNAYEFLPERFENGDSEWCPFFLGTRQCIGMNFSLLELKVNMVLIIQHFELGMSESNPDYEKLRLNSMNVIKPLDLKLKFKNLL